MTDDVSRSPLHAVERSGGEAALDSSRTRLNRYPARGHYDWDTITAILDEAFVCHVGFVVNGQPYVIPTGYGRDGRYLYIHGSAASRMLTEAGTGGPVCITVTLVDALVLARSAFNSSVNYRSVVILGHAEPVPGERKLAELEKALERERREKDRLAARLEKTQIMLELQKKVAELLEIPLDPPPIDESDEPRS